MSNWRQVLSWIEVNPGIHADDTPFIEFSYEMENELTADQLEDVEFSLETQAEARGYTTDQIYSYNVVCQPIIVKVKVVA